MTQYLPPNLLALFAPRDPVPYKPPLDRLPHEKKTKGYSGVGQFLSNFEDPKDTPPPTRVETRDEMRARKANEKDEEVRSKLQEEITNWDAHANVNATGDAFKTLFIARVNYDTSESKLRREFESYGPIKAIIMVHDRQNGKPRGFAFIEYEHERDMHSAYKYADGKKIDGRRVLVDVERARTVKDWLPRRLGGGLGGTRRGGPEQNVRHSGREEPSLAAAANRGMDDRDERRDRERDRRDRDRRRSRSRSRDRDRRRDRDRDRYRERRDRDRGDRDRDEPPRRRRRQDDEEGETEPTIKTEEPEIKNEEERDAERERRRRDRERERGDRDRDRSGRRDRDRDRDRDRRDRDRRDRGDRRRDGDRVDIKQEPQDDGYDRHMDQEEPVDPANVKIKTEPGMENDVPDQNGANHEQQQQAQENHQE